MTQRRERLHQRVVRIASAAAIFDNAVIAAGTLHIALASATLWVAKALVRILNHQRFAGRVDQIGALVEIDALVIAAAASAQEETHHERSSCKVARWHMGEVALTCQS